MKHTPTIIYIDVLDSNREWMTREYHGAIPYVLKSSHDELLDMCRMAVLTMILLKTNNEISEETALKYSDFKEKLEKAIQKAEGKK